MPDSRPPAIRQGPGLQYGGCYGSQAGALAQLGEHLLCKQGVIGSIPIRSTEEGRVEIDASCALHSSTSLLTKNGGRGATMALLPLSFSTPLESYRSCTLRCTQRAIRSRSSCGTGRRQMRSTSMVLER